MFKSYFFSILFLLVMVILETAILSNFIILPAIPDLVLICSIYFAINNGSMFGQTNGFISGLFVDFLSGGPFGVNCLVRTIIGYVFGFMKKMLNLNSILVTVLIGLIGTIIKAVLIYLVSFLFPNMVLTYHIFSRVFLFELIFNSVLTPLIFKVLDNFNNLLIIPEK